MQHRIASIVALVATFAVAPPATGADAANQRTISELRIDCLHAIKTFEGDASGDLYRATACVNYISGVADVLTLLCLAGDHARGVKPGLPRAALVYEFVSWANRNPERWNESRLSGVRAFRDRWPCEP